MEVLSDKQSKAPEGVEDVAVNVSEFSRSNGIRVPKAEDPDATECSSSFADTKSGNENCSGLSDAEVESQFYGDNGFASAFDGFNSIFPLSHPKASDWHLTLAENKRSDPDGTSTADDYGTPGNLMTKIEEIKRERVSRYGAYTDLCLKYKICFLAAVAVLTEGNTTGQDEFGTNNDGSFFEDQDNFLEQIFRKIETVHSRVHKLKAQLDLVMSKNAGKFSSSENLSNLVLADALASSVHSPTFSACNGDAISVGGIDLGDLVMPESAVSSFGEAIHIPDIIESTMGLLSHADVTLHQSQIGDSSEDIVDTVMHNQAVKAEPHTLDEIHIQSTGKPQVLERSGEEASNNPLLPAAESEAMVKPAMSQEQSFLKSSLVSEVHFPKNKRKRGERKAGTGGWSRQCPGEPDSQ
ncbi:hypothetical protein RJ639_009533 [Escallonia herrerae]|uniref:Uncharacterized protein n=1 Tax=Escallonia herrerae TaxID=1293975 RepID=A0AA89ASY5_9ASTE|nr:hypothetical protein RJ639_009533 [Escallonia herrerae]